MGDEELSRSIRKQIQANEAAALNSGTAETTEIERISPETILRESAKELRSNMLERYKIQMSGGKIIQFVHRNKVDLDYAVTDSFDEDFMRFTQLDRFMTQIRTPVFVFAAQTAPAEAIRYGWRVHTFANIMTHRPDAPLLIYRVGQSLSNPNIKSKELWYTIFPYDEEYGHITVLSEDGANDVEQSITHMVGVQHWQKTLDEERQMITQSGKYDSFRDEFEIDRLARNSLISRGISYEPRSSSPQHVEHCLGIVQEALDTFKF